MLQGTEALDDEFHIVGKHVGNFCRGQIGKRYQRRVDQARVHRTPQPYAVTGDQARAQSRCQPAQQGEAYGGSSKDERLLVDIAMRIEQAASKRHGMPWLDQGHQEYRHKTAGECHGHRQHDIGYRLDDVRRTKRACKRTQQARRSMRVRHRYTHMPLAWIGSGGIRGAL